MLVAWLTHRSFRQSMQGGAARGTATAFLGHERGAIYRGRLAMAHALKARSRAGGNELIKLSARKTTDGANA
ncbi:hypothetical protein, partial [Xanthomonas axonopodis]|uniref:hypothetical protein n=1 Tax=Xanthomonas axonopodis TaxID=53413 RepID=UPI001CA5D512